MVFYKATGRTEKITTYTRPDIKKRFQEEAEREKITLSAWIEHACIFYLAVLDRMAEGGRPEINNEVRQVEMSEKREIENKEEGKEIPYADIFGE